jgi:hypothetical protein
MGGCWIKKGRNNGRENREVATIMEERNEKR